MTMLTDQAQALREMANQSSGQARAHIVAVSSGKGGVGKSNLAVNLAIRLSQMGRRVMLLDADLGTANADVLCNIRPADTLAHVVAGRRRLDETIIQAPGGFSLIPGASGLAQMAALSEFERARLMQEMHQIEADYDLVIIDTGAGISPNVVSFALGADQLLTVTTPEPTAITDAYAMIKIISRHRDDLDVGLLVNMVKDARQGRAIYDRINAVCQRFLNLSVFFAGHVVRDTRVPLAVMRRRPFVLYEPHCAASLCVTQLAHRLDRHAANPPSPKSLLKRMTAWLTG